MDDVDITAFSTELTLTGEFESVQHLLYNTSSKSSFDFLHGHVVIFLNPNQENMRTLTNLVIMGKSNVGFGIFSSHHIPKQSTIDEIDRTWLTVKEECCGVDNLIIFYRNKNVAGEAKGVDNVDLIGSNGQPSVQSRSQFRFLWNEASAVEGKDRVLQRIAEKGKSNDSYKPLTPHWDSIIKNVLMLEGDDYAVYSSLRHEYMGTSLDDDLEIKLSPASSILGTKETKYEESQQLDGRADFMVKRTQECIPSFLHGRVRTLLDYGCAEGAITAALCRQLQVPADRAFGADVRSIASKGFTYIQIPAEMDRAPRIGEILPSLRDGCIDLITSAMVFHHVKYIKGSDLPLEMPSSKHTLTWINPPLCILYEIKFRDAARIAQSGITAGGPGHPRTPLHICPRRCLPGHHPWPLFTRMELPCRVACLPPGVQSLVPISGGVDDSHREGWLQAAQRLFSGRATLLSKVASQII